MKRSVAWVLAPTLLACSSKPAPAPDNTGPAACFVTLASAQSHPRAIALDSENVYWTDATPPALRKVPMAGGGTTELFGSTAPLMPEGPTALPSSFGSLAVASPYVFWWASSTASEATSRGPTDGSIYAMSVHTDGGGVQVAVVDGSPNGSVSTGA